MASVRAKSLSSYLGHRLREEYGLSRIESSVLVERSMSWLGGMGTDQVPGQLWLSVPATRSRRYAPSRRCRVRLTAVDVSGDTSIWEEHGLEAMQRRRLLRWIGEIRRQGGWASLTELSALASMTPNALQARLAPLRERGVWLPYVGGAGTPQGALPWEVWLVDRYLETGSIEDERGIFGLTLDAWSGILRRFTAVAEAGEGVTDPLVSGAYEVAAMLQVAEAHRGDCCMHRLLESYGLGSGPCGRDTPIGEELVGRFGMSHAAARLYEGELQGLADRLRSGVLEDGQTLFYAIDACEGARAELAEARHVPVRLSYFTAEDLERGPYGESRNRVSDLKFSRALRYATEAHSQGALLTLPDLAVLLGIHVDCIRRQIDRHPDMLVPTRGRMKDIGRGVSHRARIVELYLQMHTETEIVDRTSHSYESVESYLREFGRVLTLADRGMSPAMIRRVTGRSMSLVRKYLELYEKYDIPGHQFRLAQLRRIFTRDCLPGEKGGYSHSSTGGPMA